MKTKTFKFMPFSRKQKQILTWWLPNSPHCTKDGIIANGAIRSGKSLSVSLSFVIWAMTTFDNQNFAICGKTIGSFRRNVLFLLKAMLKNRGYTTEDKRSDNLMIVRRNGVENNFYIFGGKDERSQDLIQGITLAGALFDEVPLMPESFVKQAVARCSVDGSKFWFNCNPASPYHYFKAEWIDKLIEKNVVLINFSLDDNPAITESIKERYKRMYSGLFYKRFILGLWVMADGIIYDMFDPAKHVVPTIERAYIKYYVACDYGTYNPCTFGLYGLCDGKWYKIKQYYYDGRLAGKQKTDDAYVKDMVDFVGKIPITAIIIDPSAASFITALKELQRWPILKANNAVEDGIKTMSKALNLGTLLYNDCCKESFKEFASYIWDEKAAERGEETPLKQNDHTKDEERYFINTVIKKRSITFSK